MRRGLGRRGKASASSHLRFWIAPGVLIGGLVLYIVGITRFLNRTVHSVDDHSASTFTACIAWRSTRSCSPYGVRETSDDRDCNAWVPWSAGYCECEGSVTTARLECGYKLFTCQDACAKLGSRQYEAEALPSRVSCQEDGGGASSILDTAGRWMHRYRHSGYRASNTAPELQRSLDDRAASLWGEIRAAMSSDGQDPVVLPEHRTIYVDWVRDGVHLPREDIEAAKKQWQSFLAAAPNFPEDHFHGQGIVILAGGLTYMVPAWVNIHMLRRTGCTLPVDMFFPAPEFPTPALESALSDLGVTCRKLPEVALANGNSGLTGFTMKIAALLLSQFNEVIFLDSDNVAVSDPSTLFSSEEYQSTGALLWPDYWLSSAAPDLAGILGVEKLPEGTFESGQMVFNKQRTWRALLLAAYFNTQSHLYYELFSNYMGKGDKESFAHALQAVRCPFSTVRVPVGSVGDRRRSCHLSGVCKHMFLGNTMTQSSPDGRLMFLHTNLSPKWNLEIPGNFSEYRRRWKMMMPGGLDFWEEIGAVEQEIYGILVDLRCASFLPSYIQVLSSGGRMGGGLAMELQGFHPLNPGVDFLQAYRWGLSGPYLEFTQVSIFDRLEHFYNTAIKSRLGFQLRILLRVMSSLQGRKPYFVLW